MLTNYIMELINLRSSVDFVGRNSPGAAEKVKGAATKGYEIGKKATQDAIENVEQAAQKTGEKIKQTAGKAHGEL